MNRKQLQKLGVPPDCAKAAIVALGRAAEEGTGMGLKGKRARQLVADVVRNPRAYRGRPDLGRAGPGAVGRRRRRRSASRSAIRTWGSDIDEAAHVQMRQACQVPSAVAAALMPDAHVGYGLPIGGVLACEGAVIPYAVGVDIACRMKLSVLDMPAESLDRAAQPAGRGARRAARGSASASSTSRPQSHPVMDRDWSVTRITRERKDKAWKQLGTSGSGNHFVEFGLLTLPSDDQRTRPRGGQVRRAVEPQRQPRRGGGRVQHLQPDGPAAAAEARSRTSAGWRGSTSRARPARSTGPR